jgi:hypothetical protein
MVMGNPREREKCDVSRRGEVVDDAGCGIEGWIGKKK